MSKVPMELKLTEPSGVGGDKKINPRRLHPTWIDVFAAAKAGMSPKSATVNRKAQLSSAVRWLFAR